MLTFLVMQVEARKSFFSILLNAFPFPAFVTAARNTVTRKVTPIEGGEEKTARRESLRATTALLTSLLLSVMITACSRTAWAATFTVDRTDDDAAATACNNGVLNDCSLRGAVIKANTTADADEIILPAGTYELTVTGADPGDASIGNLEILRPVSLIGAGADTTIIDASGLEPEGGRGGVFDLDADAFGPGACGPTTISGVTIQNGRADGGGGIAVNGCSLTLTNSIVQNNMARIGGGIFASASSFSRPFSSLILINSTIDGNEATQDGGGIYITNGVPLTVSNSTVSNNTASGRGGGIRLDGSSLTLTNSTIHGNSSGSGGGGGIFTTSGATITNSTISGNTANSITSPSGVIIGGAGGGLCPGGGGAQHFLNNVTITGNTASAGGGVCDTLGGIVNLRNTILAGNTDSSGSPQPDCAGSLTSQGYNLLGDNSGCRLIIPDGVTGDQQGTAASPPNPQLAPLANNPHHQPCGGRGLQRRG